MPDEDAFPVDDPAETADRLERALERIAVLAHRASPDTVNPEDVGARAAADAAQAQEIAGRLDTLIARVRAALEDGGP